MARLLLKVELVKHEEQHYKTAGDWQIGADGCICIKVSDTGYRMDALLIALHEAVEAILCDAHNVLEADVDAFDIAFALEHKLSDEEPGEDPLAPYRREHAVADAVERIVAVAADECWREYSGRVDALFEEKKWGTKLQAGSVA